MSPGRRALGALGLCLSAILPFGCSNAPPFLASGLSSRGGGSTFASFNLLSNYGRLNLPGEEEVERGDGKLVMPEYSNQDFFSQGALKFNRYFFFSFAMVNFQLQASGGLHWNRRVALAYFPTLTLTGRHWLHGLHIETRLPFAATVSLSAYEENLPSILLNAALAEPGPVKQHRVSAIAGNFPFTFGKYRVWLGPNYRQSLDYDLRRFGVNIGLSFDRPAGE
jgi:hypothetical protein